MQRQPRIWLKTQVVISPDSMAASTVLAQWARMRQTPRHLTRAIRLYNALLQGDMACFWQLLTEYFPGVAIGMQLSARMNTQSYAEPYSTPTAKLKVETVKRSVDEMMIVAGDQFDLDGMFN